MSLEMHVTSLEHKHADLDRLLDVESARPSPDTLRMTELKREKLRLKEEIRRLSSH